MSEQPTAGADPLAGAVPTSSTPTPTAAAAAPTDTPSPTPAAAADPNVIESDMAQVLEILRAQQDTITQLRADLDARIANAGNVNVVGPGATSSTPTPAAYASGAPAHVMASALDAEPNDPIVRYIVPSANGGDPLTGYGLVIHVDTVDDADGGSHPEYVVARLDILGVRLKAENIVDEQASAAVQTRLDQAG